MEVKLIRGQNSKVVRRISNLVGMYFQFFKQDVTVAKIRQISDRDIIVVHREKRSLLLLCSSKSKERKFWGAERWLSREDIPHSSTVP